MIESSTKAMPLRADVDASSAAKNAGQAINPALDSLSKEQKKKLSGYLQRRLKAADVNRCDRNQRFASIDRTISTWQKLNKDDSERQRREDHTGNQAAIPFNLPVLASSLYDMTSYFAEALAPISNPFTTSQGGGQLSALTKRLNEDALARDYYSELVLSIRSYLKYNIAGLLVEWDTGGEAAMASSGINKPGNHWTSVDMHNMLWDPSVENPKHIRNRAEYAAMVRLTNRFEMLKKAARGEWVDVGEILKKDRYFGNSKTAGPTFSLWQDAANAVPDEQGQDSLSTRNNEEYTITTNAQFRSIGLGVPEAEHTESRPHELTLMYCWLLPVDFGLLDNTTRTAVLQAGLDPKLFLQLWRFELLDNAVIVSARPIGDVRPPTSPQIPFYLSYMTDDQLKQAQRSMMELQKGFQRFTSAMHSIYVEGMRGNVWGVQVYDPQMVDGAKLGSGTAGRLESKMPGRDVRSGLMKLDSNSGVDGALQGVQQNLLLKDQMFPSQALPSQISGMDRAVTSQVTSVVQGAQRSLRMMLRIIDSSMMLPSRMAAVRNVQEFDTEVSDVVSDLSDEDIAKSLGSGIESMEAERITESFWRLLMAIVQSQEAMQTFDTSAMMAYIGRLMNLQVDMSQFVRQQQPAGAEGTAQGTPPPEGSPQQ